MVGFITVKFEKNGGFIPYPAQDTIIKNTKANPIDQLLC